MANIAENLRDDYIDESKEILKLILNDGTIIESDSDTVDSEEEN